jgi:glutathione synthase/RimK-type ligase-like ATP-grasp enzyme
MAKLQDATTPTSVLSAAEAMGLHVYPNNASCWHFDDKVAQKYLLEAVGAPLVPSYVFYDKASALEWIGGATFPKVFKLRRGAQGRNVRLARSAAEARNLVQTAFGKGFKPVASYFADAGNKLRKGQRKGDLMGKLQRLPKTTLTIYRRNAMMAREKGYAYFQDFIPGNTFDTRVSVIGNRTFAYTRNTRAGDFRASGSGSFNFDPERINPECVRAAHRVAQAIGAQSMAFDFVLDPAGSPLIVEISYAFGTDGIKNGCKGFFDCDLVWHPQVPLPEDCILMDLLERIAEARREPAVRD